MKKVVKKRISLFNLMVALLVMAAVIVFFVNNIIAVNGLVLDNSNIQAEINKSVTLNNGLQTEIERLSNFDNIKGTAINKLNLSFSKDRPKKIDISRSDLYDLNE
jgi:cell division protein FtsL